MKILIQLYNLVEARPVKSIAALFILWAGSIAAIDLVPDPGPVESAALPLVRGELLRGVNKIGADRASLSQFSGGTKTVIASVTNAGSIPSQRFEDLVPLSESSYADWYKANLSAKCWEYEVTQGPSGTLLWSGMSASSAMVLYACPVYWPGTQDKPQLFGTVSVSFDDGDHSSSEVYPELVRLANKLGRYVPDL